MDEHQARRLSAERYGLEVSVRELPSGLDRAFRLTTESDERFVLKASPADRRSGVECEVAALALLEREAPATAPHPYPTVDGELMIEVEGVDGDSFLVRTLTWIEGQPLRRFPHLSPRMQREIGGFLGRLDQALSPFDHPGAHREHEWDMARTSALRPLLGLFPSGARRTLLTAVLDRFDRVVVPCLGELPKGVVHNDANDDNLIFDQLDPDRATVAGVIDFGDLISTVTVAEVAIACAYAMLDRDDPVAVRDGIVEGYHAERALSELEHELLPDLVRARLCSSLLISARSRQRDPDNEHLFLTEQPAWELLETLR